eukprot:14854436-Alexandrium_andersonii.AAC.1
MDPVMGRIVQTGGVARQPCLKGAPKASTACCASSLVPQVSEDQASDRELPSPAAGPTRHEL